MIFIIVKMHFPSGKWLSRRVKMLFLFSPPFSRRVKMHFPFVNRLPRRVNIHFLFSPPFSRYHNNELRKHTLIIRWLHAKAQRFAKFIPHGHSSQRSSFNVHLRTSERGIFSELLSFIFQRSSFIVQLSTFIFNLSSSLCVFAWANPAQTKCVRLSVYSFRFANEKISD